MNRFTRVSGHNSYLKRLVNLSHKATAFETFGQSIFCMAKLWRALAAGNEQLCWPHGKSALEKVHSQRKIKFYLHGLNSLPTGPVWLFISFY